MREIKKICVSSERGQKRVVESSVTLVENFGISGDYHANAHSLRQVSFLPEEVIEEFKSQSSSVSGSSDMGNIAGVDIKPGDFGENFILSGFDINGVKPGSIIELGSSVRVEVTIIGKECITPCYIYRKMGHCIMPHYGVFGIVKCGGKIKNGDSFNYCK